MEAELITCDKEGTWAYSTLERRLPKIVAEVVEDNPDFLTSEARQGLVSLQEELIEHSPIAAFQPASAAEEAAATDLEEWRAYVAPMEGKSWKEVPFYWGEAYLYRRILSHCWRPVASEKQAATRWWDPFAKKKDAGTKESLNVMLAIASSMLSMLEETDNAKTRGEAGGDSAAPLLGKKEESIILRFLLRSLWGNRADMSLFSITEDPLVLSEKQRAHHEGKEDEKEREDRHKAGLDALLSDDSLPVCEKLLNLANSPSSDALRIDIILDNAGLELFSDLCFAHVLVSLIPSCTVHLHLKEYPTFVSDATPQDIERLLSALEDSVAGHDEEQRMKQLVPTWRGHIAQGHWKLRSHRFWNSPLFFSEMKGRCFSLYSDLINSHMIFVKGDANYRRLVEDRYWPPTTSFQSLLSSLNKQHEGCYNRLRFVALRILKSDVVVGMRDMAHVQQVEAEDEQWKVDGKWGVIQFYQAEHEEESF
ncbi:Protein-glutamate O-methyltransferase family protein [Balamuthia mandrillaris]